MNNFNKTLIIILISYLVLISNWTFQYKNKEYDRTLKYKGLLWVGLDYYSIIKYNSKDKPMKVFNYQKVKI